VLDVGRLELHECPPDAGLPCRGQEASPVEGAAVAEESEVDAVRVAGEPEAGLASRLGFPSEALRLGLPVVEG
jgi:hypothetical protein